MDPVGFSGRCETKSLNKKLRLEILCAGRPGGIETAAALLEWLVEVQMALRLH